MQQTASERLFSAMTRLDASRAWRFFPHKTAQVLSKFKWQPYDYLVYTANQIVTELARGEARIVVSMPPRHGKSELVSHYLPTWYLENRPHHRVILATYETDFATEWGRKVRNTITANQSLLSVTLSEDSRAAGRWDTQFDGGMFCAGVGGPITGRGGDLLIIDDPHKNWKEAQSELMRKNIIDWFNSTAYTRLEPNASIIIVQTRWHERDLAGYCLSEHKDDWLELRLPAIAEADDLIGRKVGVALSPKRYSVERLQKIRELLGSYMWNGLYQQHPMAPEGGIFKHDWWQYYDEAPAKLRKKCSMIKQSWDTAVKAKDTAAFTVGQTWGMIDNALYLLHQYRERVEYPALKKAVKSQAEHWKPNRILIEDKSSGSQVLQDLKKDEEIKEYNLRAVKVTDGDKIVRAQLAAGKVEAGLVYLPRNASWLDVFMNEVTNFPNSAFADQVDALSQVINDDKPKVRLRW